MLINGKQREFLFSIGAYSKIAKICPDRNILRLSEVLSEGNENLIPNFMKIAVILNEQSETAKKYHGEEYNEPLTIEELEMMSFEDFPMLTKEILSALSSGQKTEVETEGSKKNTMIP